MLCNMINKICVHIIDDSFFLYKRWYFKYQPKKEFIKTFNSVSVYTISVTLYNSSQSQRKRQIIPHSSIT